MGSFEYRQAEEIRKSFTDHGARYLFLGKSGAILLGFPDTTQDADLYLERTTENCRAAAAALQELGFALTPDQIAEIERGKDFIQLKNGPFDLDLIFAPDGRQQGCNQSAKGPRITPPATFLPRLVDAATVAISAVGASPQLADQASTLSLVWMNSTATAINPNISMRDLLEQFPGAQRAMFRKYHIGGCSSCGFSPDETLAGVCARNENVDVEEAIEHIIASEAAERAMQIEPRDLADRLSANEEINLLDVRTREEWESVKLPESHLFTQELMQDILGKWSRDDLVVIYDHQGKRSMDAAAYFQGHGFENVKSLRGGIDAWSAEVDSSLPRYHLEEA